jgi:hypothetical protein
MADRLRIALGGIAVGALLTACGAPPAETVGETGQALLTRPAGAGTRSVSPVELVGRGLVLENRSHGPQLCLGPIATSLPAQCAGPDIPNWDWAKVGGETSRSGTTEGSYVAIGHFDAAANTFTLTRPAISSSDYDGPAVGFQQERAALGTPCSEPAGGWQVLDPGKTSDDSVDRTVARARDMDGYAGLWLDQSRSTRPGRNDPTQFILNVAFTRDLQAHERDLRRSWGGALCVSRLLHSEQALGRIRDEVFAATRSQALVAGGGLDYVPLEVIYDDGALQDRFDQRYGAGVVRVSSALSPCAG